MVLFKRVAVALNFCFSECCYWFSIGTVNFLEMLPKSSFAEPDFSWTFFFCLIFGNSEGVYRGEELTSILCEMAAGGCLFFSILSFSFLFLKAFPEDNKCGYIAWLTFVLCGGEKLAL